MNDRMLELADKARDAVTKDMETFQDASMCQSQARWIELYNSKFAELIVAECISKYDEWAEHSTDKTSFHLARHNIKKYFGVDS